VNFKAYGFKAKKGLFAQKMVI